MPSLHNIWKLKASVRSTSGYKGDLFQGGRLKPLFDKKSSSSRNTKASAAAAAAAPSPAASSAPSRHPIVSSFFSKFFSTSRTPAADHKPAAVDPNNHQALSATEALSRVFATPSIHGPLLQSCGYTALEVAGDTNGSSSLRDVSEKGLFLLTAQLSGDSRIQKEKRNVFKQDIALVSSATQDVWKERTWCDRNITTDSDGAAEVGVLKYEAKKVSRTTDYRAKVASCIENACEAKEDSEPAAGGDGVGKRGKFDHLDRRFLEKFAIQGALGIQQVFNRSIAYHFLHPGASLPSVGDLYARALHDVSLAGAEAPGLVIDGNHEVEYSEGRSRNSDQEGVNSRALRLLSGACCLPHPNKVKTGGEDAYFICSDEQVVGVADGVGGWADVGVNAGEYARELMSQSMIAVGQEPHGYIDPARVMLRAHARTKCRGSSTACILALSDCGLQAANLGDSGFVLMRNGQTIFKSPVQQHQFNIPFQLESGGSDPPSAAEVFSLQVAAGDVIVAGTDGLFDNLYDNELMGVVVHSTRAGLGPQVTAQKIVALARERAEDRNRQTPFSTAAQEAGFRFYGGKMDDITVIVSYITNAKSASVNPPSKA